MRNYKENRNFKFKKLYHKAIQGMTDKQAGEFIKALCTYVFTDNTVNVTDPFVYGLLVFVKKDIDTAAKNSANGKMGARPCRKKAAGTSASAVNL